MYTTRGTNLLHQGFDLFKLFYIQRLSMSFINKHNGLDSVLSWAQTKSDHAASFSTSHYRFLFSRRCLSLGVVCLVYPTCVIFRFRVSGFILCDQLFFAPATSVLAIYYKVWILRFMLSISNYVVYVVYCLLAIFIFII